MSAPEAAPDVAASAEDLPEEVKSWIGTERYREDTEFPIEMGYVYTSCASVENGNPLFWDDAVAQDVTLFRFPYSVFDFPLDVGRASWF